MTRPLIDPAIIADAVKAAERETADAIAAWLEAEAQASGLFHVETTLTKAAEHVRGGRWRHRRQGQPEAEVDAAGKGGV